MVFKAKGAHTYKIKVAIQTRPKARTFSTGATVKAVADDVERMVERMKGRRQLAALEAVFDDLTTLAAVYDADVNGTLETLLADLRDVDLDPLLSEWAERANAKYVRQVRLLIVEGERFPASHFRRKRVSEFLAGLTCAAPTKNRYRAALSVFAKWLVEREVIDANPVRDVAMYKERDPRMVWMTWADAERVANAAGSVECADLFAILAATGIELGAGLELMRASVIVDKGALIPGDAYSIHANGTKTGWRNRVVFAETWAERFILRALGRAVGGGQLFPSLDHASALDAFKAAQKAVGLTGHRLHDLRHTYAVNALKKGYKPTVVAHQLGHKDATMVTKVYGRFVPDSTDYVVTNPATTSKKRHEVRRAK